MNREIQIQIACVISDIFLDCNVYRNNSGDIIVEATRKFYEDIASQILQIAPKFSKSDLDIIFPVVAYCCMYIRSISVSYDECDEFDKDLMRVYLKNDWSLNRVFGVFYKPRVKYKYNMLCCALGFYDESICNCNSIYTYDREIPEMLHIPLFCIVIGAIGISFVASIEVGTITLACAIVAFYLSYMKT